MGVTGYLLASGVFAVAGGLTLQAGLLDREMAAAEERLVAGDAGRLERVLERAEQSYAYLGKLPWIGHTSPDDLAARRTALQYRAKPSPMHEGNADRPDGAPEGNLELQFLVANARYRATIAQAKDRQATLSALETGIAAYLTVLRNAGRHEDAAFNYEYLLRLRDEIRQGKRKTVTAPEPDSPYGRRGAPQSQDDMGRFKLYIPLDGKELEKSPAGEAGTSAPIRRKG